MRVCFVHINDWPVPVPGVATLATVVQRAGHDVKLVDLTFHRGARLRTVEDALESFRPDVLCLSVFDDLARDVCRAAKRMSPAPTIVIGGSYATMFPKEVLAAPEVDAVGVGDGEEAICDLLERLARGPLDAPIPGFWIKLDGAPVDGGLRPPVDLARVPSPDWSLWDIPKYLEQCPTVRGAMAITASRGCPYACAFCARHTLRHANPGPRYTVRPAAQVVEEIATLYRRYGDAGMRYVVFFDHIFGVQPAWMNEFCEAYRAAGLAKALPWVCQTRVEHVSDKWVDLARNAGCALVEFGVETVDDDRRRHLLKKPIAKAAIESAAARLRRAGIAFNAYLMVGVPGNTRREIDDSVRYVESLGTRITYISRFVPLRGTPLGDACREAGSVEERAGKDDRVRPDVMSERALTAVLWHHRLRRFLRLSQIGFREQGGLFPLRLARETFSVVRPSGIGPTHPLALISMLDRVVNLGVLDARAR